MNSKTKRLRDLAKWHNLTDAAIGKILNRSSKTIEIWRCKSDNRVIPDHSLLLLELHLSAGQHVKN